LLRASIARETVRGSDLDLLADLMRDDDDLVREAVARAIDSSPVAGSPNMTAILEAAREVQASTTTCSECGSQIGFAGRPPNCASCGHSLPDSLRRIEPLLATATKASE
jgi:ribosomal protein L37E